jgi:hypothetical protein
LDTDWLARGLAIVGLLLGVGSLAWNIFSWRRGGPTLKLKAKCSGRGVAMSIAGNVRNIGRSDAELEKATFSWDVPTGGGSKRLRRDAPDQFITGITLPQTLAAEKGKEFKFVSLRDLDPGLDAALHEQRAAYLTFHTASGRKARGRIKYERS